MGLTHLFERRKMCKVDLILSYSSRAMGSTVAILKRAIELFFDTLPLNGAEDNFLGISRAF